MENRIPQWKMNGKDMRFDGSFEVGIVEVRDLFDDLVVTLWAELEKDKSHRLESRKAPMWHADNSEVNSSAARVPLRSKPLEGGSALGPWRAKLHRTKGGCLVRGKDVSWRKAHGLRQLPKNIMGTMHSV